MLEITAHFKGNVSYYLLKRATIKTNYIMKNVFTILHSTPFEQQISLDKNTLRKWELGLTIKAPHYAKQIAHGITVKVEILSTRSL